MPKRSDGNYFLDFDPLTRAESMMAKLADMTGVEGFGHMKQQREEVRDLVLLSIAKSLRTLASSPSSHFGG